MGFTDVMKRLTIIAGLLLVSAAHAQWTEPARITDLPGTIDPHGIAIGDTLHVVVNIGFQYFRYFRSSDNGYAWTGPFIPMDSILLSYYTPDIIVSDGIVHIAGKGRAESPSREQVFHISSSDGGRSWSGPHQVFNNNTAYLKSPHLAANGDSLYLACYIEHKLLTFRSFDGGVTWQDSTLVEGGTSTLQYWPLIFYSEGRLILIYDWVDFSDPTAFEIYCRLSDDHGITWSGRYSLSTNDLYHSFMHSAFVDSDGNIAVMWRDYKYGSLCGFTGDILGRISNDNGETWGPETRITDTQSGYRISCAILDGVLHVVWTDGYPVGCNNAKTMYSASVDWGRSWLEPFVISGPVEYHELAPVLFYGTGEAGTVFHSVITRDEPDDHRYMYHFRNEDITPVTRDGDKELPNSYELSVYPNPFNNQVIISLTGWRGEESRLSIYDLTGRLVRSLELEEGKATHTGQVTWDATDNSGRKVSSGIYFARVGGRRSVATKLVYLR